MRESGHRQQGRPGTDVALRCVEEKRPIHEEQQLSNIQLGPPTARDVCWRALRRLKTLGSHPDKLEHDFPDKREVPQRQEAHDKVRTRHQLYLIPIRERNKQLQTVGGNNHLMFTY
jgi:hypothetical protein